MGTLFEQAERKALYVNQSEVKNLLEDALELSKKYKIPLETILKAYEIKEIERRNNLYKSNGDAFDEQMSGFGQILEKISASLDSISEK